MWKKLFLAGVAAATLAGGAGVIARAATPQSATVPVVDVKGPCDEPEHATDPRCAGAQEPEDRPNDDGREDEAEDRHGDDGREAEDRHQDENEAEDENEDEKEAEHEAGDDEVDDRSGPSDNSGPSDSSGSGHDDSGSDNSGPGSDD